MPAAGGDFRPSNSVHKNLKSISPGSGSTVVSFPLDIPGPPGAHGARAGFDDGVSNDEVTIDGEPFLRIRHVDRMPPFLMNVVSDCDFWLFVSSNGGFTAGRVDPDHALFPYQNADRILRQPRASGALCLLEPDGIRWEPWSDVSDAGDVSRDLLKHAAGTSVRFEEIHHRLRMKFVWTLAASRRFGLVRTCRLENLTDRPRQVRMLDGFHQILPAGVSQDAYLRYSYLASAYMRHELDRGTGLAIITLNSGITDRAEPSESMRASVAWALGHGEPVTLLCDRQLEDFRRGGNPAGETEVRGEFGAHLTFGEFAIGGAESREWITVADTGLDHAGLLRLRKRMGDREALREDLLRDLAENTRGLRRRIAGAGAGQQTADSPTCVHHFANVLFNCMRGGTLTDGCIYQRPDFANYLESRNRPVRRRHEAWLMALEERGPMSSLADKAAETGDPQLVRIVREYLPLSFSRRHGDPSRPWNRFEIRTSDGDGNPLFGYSGNWRDIFQNWESLAFSYPECFAPMIAVFLNASTADGYNPYRITRKGIDWEVLDPKDPWSHIGYWGDHQIIYLLKLLEGQERFWPGALAEQLGDRTYAYANVPYEIRGIDAITADPRHSIDFNQELHGRLLRRECEIGGDGRLLADASGETALVTLGEKLLVPVLVKLANLVPGGGIWLNTQRPEWNDANNALAGWGLSMVTVCYIRRYLVFLSNILADSRHGEIGVSSPVLALMREIAAVLPDSTAIGGDRHRWQVARALGQAGETHRRAVYRRQPFPTSAVRVSEIRDFLATAITAVEATLASGWRDDGMFHSYSVLALHDGRASVRHLDLMLEGQVAALSGGFIDADQALRLLRALRGSPLYRKDQNSYMLYPDRDIQPFAERHALPGDWRERAPLLADALDHRAGPLVTPDDDGGARFHADFTNARDLQSALDRLAAAPGWSGRVGAGRAAVMELWEEVFRHRDFTGRSGAMFAFEGLGSIYWHMVAKLLLAVQEIHIREAVRNPGGREAAELAAAYGEVRAGLGFTKDARTYGAFPSDPYSHSPWHRGAQQPGMTGQVKEEILTRLGELGVRIAGGRVRFEPTLLKRAEFFDRPHEFRYFGVGGSEEVWPMDAGTLAFTLFQVPVSYRLAASPSVSLEMADGGRARFEGTIIPESESRSLFRRSGLIRRIHVAIPETETPSHCIP